MAWACGLFASSLDFAKAAILIVTADYRAVQRRTAAFAFLVLTVMSLWAAGGNILNQQRDRAADKATATTEYDRKDTELKRLVDRRRALSFEETTETTVTAARKRAEDAERQRALECDGSRGKAGNICRDREADKRRADDAVVAAEREKGKTDDAHALNRQIAGIQGWLDDNRDKLRKKSEVAAAESLSLIDAVIFALAVELGSGLLPWLMFGHGRREENIAATLAPVPDTDEIIRQRFFDQAVLPSKGKHVTATNMHRAYVLWCRDHGHTPMSPQDFGRDSPRTKRKVGTVRYIDSELVPRYAPRNLRIVAG
jgi:hypothetical protein